MQMVTLSLSDVKLKIELLPNTCPYCSGKTYLLWGHVSKPVKDHRYPSVLVYQNRYYNCHRTLRYYPDAMDRADQIFRFRKLPTLFWV
jgi:hypothetical protein